MACECVMCKECRGSGTVWRSFNGEYLGSNRWDDLDESEYCPVCDGDGIEEMCAECQQAIEEEREGEYEV